MELEFSPRFIKDYQHLDQTVQSACEKAIEKLAKNIQHPSLRVRKIINVPLPWTGKIYEARVDRKKFRLTFHIEDEVIYLRRCGKHEIYKMP